MQIGNGDRPVRTGCDPSEVGSSGDRVDGRIQPGVDGRHRRSRRTVTRCGHAGHRCELPGGDVDIAEGRRGPERRAAVVGQRERQLPSEEREAVRLLGIGGQRNLDLIDLTRVLVDPDELAIAVFDYVDVVLVRNDPPRLSTHN
jgi:hypothetical protein